MTRAIRFTRRAESELREIAAWYRERSGSPEVADRWLAGFFAKLDDINSDPQRFSTARESEALGEDIWEAQYGSGKQRTHRILFRILDDAVEVVGVRHFARRDLTPDDLS